MESERRKRGRPPGGGKDDSQILARLADRMLASPTRPMTAIKELLDRPEIKDIDRIQRKWRKSQAALMAAAKRRATPPSRDLAASRRSFEERCFNQLEQASAMLNDPTVQKMYNYMASAEWRQMQELMLNPELKRARELMNDPHVQSAIAAHRSALNPFNR